MLGSFIAKSYLSTILFSPIEPITSICYIIALSHVQNKLKLRVEINISIYNILIFCINVLRMNSLLWQTGILLP